MPQICRFTKTEDLYQELGAATAPSPPHPPGDAQHSRISLLAPVSLCASSRAGIIDRAQVPARCS